MDEDFVTIEQVAKHYKVSISTVRAWIRQDIVPHLKLGGVYRLKYSAIEKAFAERAKDTPEAPQPVTAVVAPEEAVVISPDQDV